MAKLTKPGLLNETGQAMVAALNEIALAVRGADKKSDEYTVYGFHVNENISDPEQKVTYLKDAVGMAPAAMNYTTGVFNWGSWANAFFMPRPCMLNYDGTVAYYLDPNDYTKKIDGTDSAIADTSVAGNFMMEWGSNGNLIWTKVVPDAGDEYSGSIYIANYKADSDFTAYQFINCNGDMVNHFYTPIYNGSEISGKLRSISGQTVVENKDASEEVTIAKANYADAAIWNTEVLCDIDLINNLLILMGKSLDTQTVFGKGMSENEWNENLLLKSGTMNDKGLFWGENTGKAGVKVFGMENYWGNQWRRYAGYVNDNGAVKVKLCYGKSDGSTTDTYNTTGAGYINTGITPSGTSGGYIDKAKFVAGGIRAERASGSSTTHYCDGLWFNNGQNNYALRGGALTHGVRCGAFCVGLDDAAGHRNGAIGAAPSCKPLVMGG